MWRILFVVLGTSLLVQCAQVQSVSSVPTDWRESSARKIVAHYREYPQGIVPILRQSAKPQPQAKLDEIVASLVKMAVAAKGCPNDALYALYLSGKRSSGSDDERNAGTPFPGMLDRLIRIDREAHNVGVRESILRYMLEMPEHTRALDHLLSVTTTDSGFAAWGAMRALISEVNPENKTPRGTTPQDIAETIAALRALWGKYSAEPLPRTASGMLFAEGGPSRVIPNGEAATSFPDHARDLDGEFAHEGDHIHGFDHIGSTNITPHQAACDDM